MSIASSLRGGLRWLKRGVLVAVCLVLLVGLAEIALRVVGYGYTTQPFIKRELDGKRVYLYNAGFFRRFLDGFASDMWAYSQFEVPADKPEGMVRVMFYGGGQAWGWPDSTLSFSRFAEVLLRDRFPEGNFEIYNAAYPFMNSHTARRVVEAAGPLQIDVFVLYIGGNEFIGPFGPVPTNTYRPVGDSMEKIAWNFWLAEWRVVQWSNMLRYWPWFRWPGAIEPSVEPGDAISARTFAHYRENIEAMAAAAGAQGAKVLLCGEASNVREWRPTASEPMAPMLPVDKQHWHEAYVDGMRFQSELNYERALVAYRRALQLCEKHGDLNFRTAECLWALQRTEEAAPYYRAAFEYDVYYWARAREEAFAIARAAADASDHVSFVDVAAYVAELAPLGLPGSEFFADQVHPSLEGAYAIAGAVVQALHPLLPQAVVASIPADTRLLSFAAACTRLAVNPNVMAGATAGSVQQFYSNGIAKPAAAERRLRFWQRLAESTDGESVRQIYEAALAENPDDMLIGAQQLYSLPIDEAIKKGEAMVARYPLRRLPRRTLAAMYGRGNRVEEAKVMFDSVFALDPRDVASCMARAEMHELLGDTDSALTWYQKAAALEPGESRPLVSQARLLRKEGDNDAAIETFAAAINVAAYDRSIYEELDGLLQTGDAEDRAELWREIESENPEVPLAMRFAARAQLAIGETERARALLQRAQELEPFNAEVAAELSALPPAPQGSETE